MATQIGSGWGHFKACARGVTTRRSGSSRRAVSAPMLASQPSDAAVQVAINVVLDRAAALRGVE